MEKISKFDFKNFLRNGCADVVYPKINSKEGATILANSLQGSQGIVVYVNEDNKIVYGVLYSPYEWVGMQNAFNDDDLK